MPSMQPTLQLSTWSPSNQIKNDGSDQELV